MRVYYLVLHFFRVNSRTISRSLPRWLQNPGISTFLVHICIKVLMSWFSVPMFIFSYTCFSICVDLIGDRNVNEE